MKQILFILVFLLSASIATAHLSDYPSPFLTNGDFNAQIIVGNEGTSIDSLAASEIAIALQQSSSSVITANMDDEFDPNKNAILIGLPCQNTAIATILETNACDIGLNEGEGYLKLVDLSGISYLIVTGKTASDTRKTARFLAEEDLSNYVAHELRIGATLESPAAKSEQQPLEIKKIQVECTEDDDCTEEQSCIGKKCLNLGCWEGTIAKNHDCIAVEVEQEPEPVAEFDPNQEPIDLPNNEEGTAEIDAEIVEDVPPKQGFFGKIISFIMSIFT